MNNKDLILSAQTILVVNPHIKNIHISTGNKVWYGDEHVPEGYDLKMTRDEVMNWQEHPEQPLSEKSISKTSKKETSK